jgi:hypothetical protein
VLETVRSEVRRRNLLHGFNGERKDRGKYMKETTKLRKCIEAQDKKELLLTEF